MSLIISQIICIFGLIMFIISMQQKRKEKILVWQSLSFFMYGIQYLVLGAFTGMTIYLLNILRNILIYFVERKKKSLKYIGIVFIFISIYLTLLQYDNYYDVLPACTSIINILFLLKNNVIKIKIAQIIASSIWIVYDIISQAYIAGLSELIIIISTIYCILKIDKKISIYMFFKNKISTYKRKIETKHKKTKLLCEKN